MWWYMQIGVLQLCCFTLKALGTVQRSIFCYNYIPPTSLHVINIIYESRERSEQSYQYLRGGSSKATRISISAHDRPLPSSFGKRGPWMAFFHLPASNRCVSTHGDGNLMVPMTSDTILMYLKQFCPVKWKMKGVWSLKITWLFLPDRSWFNSN